LYIKSGTLEDLLHTFSILRKYFYSLEPIFVFSTKCIDPWLPGIRGFKHYSQQSTTQHQW